MSRNTDLCSNCAHREADCTHELRDELVVYLSRNPEASCPCRA
ncbi:MAG: hypothetical protein ACLFSW_03115 [Halobacteriales archaeon]